MTGQNGQNGHPGNADMGRQEGDGHPYHRQAAAAAVAGLNLRWSSADAEAGRNPT